MHGTYPSRSTEDKKRSTELRDSDVPLSLQGKNVVLNWFGWHLPPRATHWLLVEVALLFTGLTQIFFVKNWFCPVKEEINVF